MGRERENLQVFNTQVKLLPNPAEPWVPHIPHSLQQTPCSLTLLPLLAKENANAANPALMDTTAQSC